MPELANFTTTPRYGCCFTDGGAINGPYFRLHGPASRCSPGFICRAGVNRSEDRRYNGIIVPTSPSSSP